MIPTEDFRDMTLVFEDTDDYDAYDDHDLLKIKMDENR